MGDLQPLPPLLDGTDATGDGGGGGGTGEGIDGVDIGDGGGTGEGIDGVDIGDGGAGSPNAVEDNQLPVAQLPPTPNPHPSAIAAENWQHAEDATRRVLRRIRPTVVSEQRRKAVVEYVQKAVKSYIGSEVYPFGSVPLKTYLPDGDIDLTALGLPNTEDNLANEVHSFLVAEEHKKDPAFEVKDVQFIHAEVKLVKCIVQNIVVDISFNQIGGLSTLCFLEKVDQKIGKDNIFKRSIILIKAWCYYESRILGAHHGLISTYALETLVMYVFHLFHKSLDGPLAVLYTFLDFYSKFDWDNYCVSLHGSVLVSSLPELIVEPPETDGSDLLFSKDFIKECADTFSVPLRGLETNSRIFPQKHLNIIDPLKQNNNLGRSVSKGNFYRIRSAFTYGARKLGRILLLPAESIADEVSMFFTNTLDRHGTGERPDVQDATPSCSENGTSDHARLNSFSSHLKVDNDCNEMLVSGLAISDFNGTLIEETNNNISGTGKEYETRMQANCSPSCHLDVRWLPNGSKLECNRSMKRETVSDAQLFGDARDLASTRTSTSRIIVDTLKTSSSENGSKDEIADVMNSKDDSLKNAALNRTGDDDLSYVTEASSSTSWLRNDRALASSPSSSCMSEESNFADSLNDAKENIGNGRSQSLADLSGHFQLHFGNFLYALHSQEFTLNSFYLPIPPSSPSHYQSSHSWNSFHQRNMYSHIGANGIVPGASFSTTGCYLYNQPMVSGTYSTKDIQPTRGTGTYFPNTNFRPYKERQPAGRAKNQMHASNPPRSRYNCRNETLQDKGLLDEGNDEPSPRPQQASVFGGSGRVKPAPLELSHSRYPPFKGIPHSNGFAHQIDGKTESGMRGAASIGVSSPERGDNSEHGSSFSQDPGSRAISSPLQKPSTSVNRESPAQPYQLKDKDDFPPLMCIQNQQMQKLPLKKTDAET